MKTNEILQRIALFNAINVQFLDFLDEKIDENDETIIKAVNSFFENKKNFSYSDIKNEKIFSSLPTSIGMLTSIIFYIKNLKESNFNIDFEFVYKKNNTTENPDVNELIRTIRNVIAHNGENEGTEIVAANDSIYFKQDYRGNKFEIEFDTNNFRKFVMWLIRTTRESMR